MSKTNTAARVSPTNVGCPRSGFSDRGEQDRKPPAAQTATNIKATPEVWGPLVRQPEPAARFARILHNAAQELWDVCTYDDAPQMWEEARAIASRILAAAGH